MGTGASIEIQTDAAKKALENASADEIHATLSDLPQDTKTKLRAVLTEPVLSGATTNPSKSARIISSKWNVTNNGKIFESYAIEKNPMGGGRYASVSKAKSKITGQVVVVKSVSKMKSVEQLKVEVEIQAAMSHPNVSKVWQTFEDYRNLYLVMDLMTGGDLLDCVIDRGCINQRDASAIMKQAFQAELYINERGVCHRDIKPENFMFLNKDSLECLKLMDFGSACSCTKDQVLTTKAGTSYYVAPQVIHGKYDMSADVWSLGVLLYVLCAGHPPFFGETDSEVLSQVRLGNFTFIATEWGHVSEDCKNLIRACLKMSPRDRVTPELALKHVWISQKDASECAVVDSEFLKRFKQFRAVSKFKNVARDSIAMMAKEGDIKKLKDALLPLDLNGDGTVSPDEVKRCLEKIGLESAELNDLIGSIGASKVDYEELLALTQDRKVYTDIDQLWSVCSLFDKNGNGQLDVEGLQKMLLDGSQDLAQETQTAIEKAIAEANKSLDSQIDFNQLFVL
mmetsp:Transcript_46036/g.72761  ORF Transcript_46036/g.72761 Transcript_46036/m.72761 type:complete len:511 (-) Transcript_46036:55-1587(-)|eukprot:CAMPEP_0169072386 /NCGR_PEP_ID=MMETSP1015-20121227/6168_1 /TAXON_ID=342587 /ORGANISM="Karlodinium micrum, Strain CCMP2283" /LENGTH=510 /DNA_ID=CAMNT_0009131541 /DNA_START=51 /DNA_END=1583 /DNA_ORIENTATION=-